MILKAIKAVTDVCLNTVKDTGAFVGTFFGKKDHGIPTDGRFAVASIAGGLVLPLVVAFGGVAVHAHMTMSAEDLQRSDYVGAKVLKALSLEKPIIPVRTDVICAEFSVGAFGDGRGLEIVNEEGAVQNVSDITLLGDKCVMTLPDGKKYSTAVKDARHLGFNPS